MRGREGTGERVGKGVRKDVEIDMDGLQSSEEKYRFNMWIVQTEQMQKSVVQTMNLETWLIPCKDMQER